ncbi:tripartite tricarboxylate transporter substrate binding protein [Pseudooceanicola sp. CBS1P-1]|uniref:Tripartite tricarboxylate transporter substrate binding protein n=1 Tax=Pseudooceanicola albus TaxID=2692189 RepID=A0A6L7G5J6_9RHOB|nr:MULTISPECIES: tripartite tricarboxylate transporter substrate binding protein [Pseudooceanicola]MBT9385659.1 tripartite tricarboxylate transporter substrate binding protein [Pseudooceanicola endophyticus]MXN18932.1 tripartite tricarboxylate transporter substrate binding protein [Pseudooceanicola albus]
MKTFLAGLALLAVTTTAALAADDFPKKEIQGVIQWGAGGSTDTVMRAVTPHAAEALGGSIVMQNKTGGVGAIALRYVQSQKADGYTLLMGAENPQMYKVLGLGSEDYNDMIPINVLARGVPMFVANNDAPYSTMSEFVDYAKAHPGEVRVGSTGPGGLTSIVLAMLTSQVDIEFTRVPYDGDGPALTALQGGALDVMPVVLGAGIEAVKAGRMKVIGLVDVAENPLLPGVEPITKSFPGFANYLPWGPFFGVFVKKGTPAPVVEKLQAAFAEGAQNPDFQKLMKDRGFIVMSLAGDQAMEFLDSYRSTSSWLVHDAGFAKKSPEEFGIPKP